MSISPTTTGSRIIDRLSPWQPEMVDLISRLALAESPSHVPESQLEPQRIIKEFLQRLGFRTRLIPGRTSGGHLLAIPRERKRDQPIQLLLGHCDTVWPLGTLEKMPVEQREGRLHGPGVYDMKAGIVQSLFAIKAIQNLSLDCPVAPVVFINSDEEIGSHESTPFIRRLAQRCNRAFVMEPSLGPEGLLKTARKGVGRFTVRIEGRAAHAGLSPEEGASAILELSHVVQSLFALNDLDRGITVNVGVIDGGLRPNVIAPESTATVDVRVVSHQDAEEIESAIHQMKSTTPGTQLHITGKIARPPMERTPGNKRLWEFAVEAANELDIAIEQGSAGGGSDGNTTSLYSPTLDGLGAVGDGAHALTEFVYIDRLVERTALLARLLIREPLEACTT